MPTMISLRTFTLPTLTGNTLRFEAKVPRFVPDNCVKDAFANGCALEDGTPEDIAKTYDEAGKTKVNFIGDLRSSIIFLAIKSVFEANITKEFDASGSPKRSVISDRVGFEVPIRELQSMSQTYRTHRAEGTDFPLHEDAPKVVRAIEADSHAELLDLAEEFGLKKEDLKDAKTRPLRRIVLQKLSGYPI